MNVTKDSNNKQLLECVRTEIKQTIKSKQTIRDTPTNSGKSGRSTRNAKEADWGMLH